MAHGRRARSRITISVGILLLAVGTCAALAVLARAWRFGEPASVGTLERAYYLAQIGVLVTAVITAVIVVREGRRFIRGVEMQVFDTTAAQIHEFGQQMMRHPDLLDRLKLPVADQSTGDAFEPDALFAQWILDFFQVDMFRRAYFPDYTSRFPTFTEWALETFRSLPGVREVAIAQRYNYSYGLFSLIQRAGDPTAPPLAPRDRSHQATSAPMEDIPYVTIGAEDSTALRLRQLPGLRRIEHRMILQWGCLPGDRVRIVTPRGREYDATVRSPVLEDETPDWASPTYRVMLGPPRRTLRPGERSVDSVEEGCPHAEDAGRS